MKKFFKYILFVFVCLYALPIATKAATYNLGTLAPGAEASKSYAWWDEGSCVASTNGVFTFTERKSYYAAKDSWYRYLDIKVNDYVEKDYNNLSVTCTVRDVRNPDPSKNAGRVFSWRTYTFKFNVSAGGQAAPVENPKVFYLYKGDSINLKNKLGIDTIESFTQSVGGELGTISYSNCSGTSACTINFTRGTPLQDRPHKFTVVYKGTNGTRYRSVVTVYEMDTKRTIDLGSIEPTASIFGAYEENVSNFNCTNSVASVPAGVTKDGSGTKYRIKVTNNNTSNSTYSNKTAVCTFIRDGKNFEYTYTYSLKKYNPETVTKNYEKYPGEVVDIFSDLSMKSIVSVSPSYNSAALTYTGCVGNATSCKVTMKDTLTEGRVNTFTIYYYDTANKFKLATVTIKEKGTTISNNLGTIGVGNTKTTTIPASNVTCVAADSTKPYTATLTKVDDYQYTLSIKNTNKTVKEYAGITYTCTGVPRNVGGRSFSYVYTFALSAESNPVVNAKYYELFPSETLEFVTLFGIKKARSYTYDRGSEYNTIQVFGCSDSAMCKASFVSPTALHNRQHQITVTYVNDADVLYKTVVTIVEKDPSISTKAYPGLLGFCDFDKNKWELASWADTSGKNYVYYEATERGAPLPDCKIDPTQNTEKLPLTFKGWTKGYKAGDALTTKSTCGTDLLAPGKPTSSGQTYAPCYEMAPHVRVSTNSGSLKNADGFEFRASDMTYIKFGSSFTQKVRLPDVEYTGFHSSSSLTGWRNNSTGEVKNPGAEVYLDGSVWVAISNRTVSQVDLYKTVGLNETTGFNIPNMTSCSVEGGTSDFVNASGSSGYCSVTGKKVTPFDVYANVLVTLQDGTVRVYKFNVEDRSHILDDDNGIFNVDTEDDIVVGKNDEKTLNDFKTDQCENFFISRNEYVKYTFANAKPNNGFGAIDMNTGIYKVYQLCPTDYSNYVALCLDPGRRGPNEGSSSDTTTKTFNYKGSSVTVSGNEYKKTSDVQKDSEFGKLVMHIVQTFDISKFDENSGRVLQERAAAHVAVRSMAIHTGFSKSPDPSNEVYASHYYPYLGVAGGITDGLADGDIDEAEARSAVYNGKNGYGFQNWRDGVDDLVIQLLADYGGSTTTEENDGFSRTIEKSTYTPNGNSYTINYVGTITAPTGADARMEGCRKPGSYGVVCTVNSWSLKGESGGRKTYQYDVTITVPDASKVKSPTNVEEEKDLSFQISYTGGADIINSFIATAKDSSYNLQRMLIISTTNPKVYIYFSVVPENCDLEVLKQDKCDDETECTTNINNKTFNAVLFKASGCCRYVKDEGSYLFRSICSAQCTSSTMTSVCAYVPNGKEKADLYEIKEGSQYKGTALGYQDSIGTCVVNVNDFFVNDGAAFLSTVDPGKNFTKYDDVENLINVNEYNRNRYCQVTCKEDWQFSMDSFGNFIGADAVAAGTYFQIVSNDMFMSGQRTCYSTFINYDRFMSNVVDLSNELVKAYNRYSRWSHVWTDIDRQVDKGYQSVKRGYYISSPQNDVCVEYFDKCPQRTSSSYDDYYWSEEVQNCRRVPHYGSSSGYGGSPVCQNKPTTNQGDDYSDGPVTYTNNGANNDSTECTFVRTYCDGNHNEKSTDSEVLVNSNTKCQYKTYKTRSTTSKVYTYKPRPTKTCPKGVTGPCYDSCGTGWTASGSRCKKKVCPSGYTDVGGTCYKNTCPAGYPNSYDSKECYKYAYTGTHTATLYMDPAYEPETLKCKVYGKGYDFTLRTENEVEEVNSDGKDIYYNTKEYDKKASEGYDDRDSIANKGDNNRQNKTEDGSNVKGNYSKVYKHDCTLTPAPYKPYDGTTATQGSSKCVQTLLSGEQFTPSTYQKDNEMFCKDGGYADLSSVERDKAFCKVNANHTNNNRDATKTYASTDYAEKEDAFEWITTNFLEHSKKELDNARFTMQSYYSQIYSHAHDIFKCQNFELRNTTDDKDANRSNNTITKDTIMGKQYDYINIPTQFDPFATYDYDEKFFMDRIPEEDRYLIQYTEKNDAVFGGDGKYASSTDRREEIEIDVPNSSTPVKTWLARNYTETYYYNPITPWQNVVDPGDANVQVALDRVNKYHDPRYQVTNPVKAQKKIVLCTVGVISNGTKYWEGKDGEFVAFASTSTTPEWLGGRCYQVTVDYKKVHYVKASILNSSYYKNRGYWYVRGGDTKVHGDNIEDAIEKFNGISRKNDYGITFNANDTDELKRWSRLGSFNVFPVSMATPRNLYSYTYSFGNVGSYYNDDLGRIMGKGEQSIITNNIRTCVYEVYEEVCLCCGYKVEPDEIVEQVAKGHGDYSYIMSNPDEAGGDTRGNITFYTNSVSLSDLDLGRDSNTTGTNWSQNSPFMYNGDEMTTDKGYLLKDNIEATGENIYSRDPEYAYYLTPDTLKQIRSYNDANGYDLNLDKLIVYDVSKIECDGNSCEEGNPETINFQHYGSKFLIGKIDGPIDLKSYGTIGNSYTNVCLVEDTSLTPTFDMAGHMEKGKCRWVDFVETGQRYRNPTTRQESNTWFRLSFK